MGHELTLTIMDRKLFLAPIGESPQRVVDIATGTGLWAIDFGTPLDSTMELYSLGLTLAQPTITLLPRPVVFLRKHDRSSNTLPRSLEMI